MAIETYCPKCNDQIIMGQVESRYICDYCGHQIFDTNQMHFVNMSESGVDNLHIQKLYDSKCWEIVQAALTKVD